MVTLDGEEAEIEIEIKFLLTEIYVGGHWLAEFACKKDATSFKEKIKQEGRSYSIKNNKVVLND
jgi:hypothetical protein